MRSFLCVAVLLGLGGCALLSGRDRAPEGLGRLLPGLPAGERLWDRQVALQSGDRLVRAWRKGELLLFESANSRVTALSPAGGGFLFQVEMGGPLCQEPAAAGSIAVLVALDRIFAIEARDGRVLLDLPLELLPSGPPCIVGETVYLPTQGPDRLASFSLRTGKPGWRGVSAAGSGLVACAAQDGPELLVLHLDSGAVVGLPARDAAGPAPNALLWESPGAGGPGSLLSGAGALALLACPEARILALSARTGTVLWVHAARLPAIGPAAPFGERILVPFHHGMECLDAATGACLWTFEGEGVPIALREEGLFAASGEWLFRLDPASGAPIGCWRRRGVRWIRNETDAMLFGWSEGGRVLALGK